ncbi:MAG: hypothetical protein ACI9YB_001980 [Halioglobus sp.]|jgi:hypothetical protein
MKSKNSIYFPFSIISDIDDPVEIGNGCVVRKVTEQLREEIFDIVEWNGPFPKFKSGKSFFELLGCFADDKEFNDYCDFWRSTHVFMGNTETLSDAFYFDVSLSLFREGRSVLWMMKDEESGRSYKSYVFPYRTYVDCPYYQLVEQTRVNSSDVDEIRQLMEAIKRKCS